MQSLLLPDNISTTWKVLKPVTLLASMNSNAGPSSRQTFTISQTLLPETVAHRAPHIEILKTQVGPITRLMNTTFGQLGPSLSLAAQIPAGPLRFERFQKAMDYLCCRFDCLNLVQQPQGIIVRLHIPEAMPDPEPFLHHIKGLLCLLQGPAPLTTLCIKPRWHRSHLNPALKVVQGFQQARIS